MRKKNFRGKSGKALSYALVFSMLLPSGVAVNGISAKAQVMDENYKKNVLWSTSFESAENLKISTIEERGTENVDGGPALEVRGSLYGQIGEAYGSNSDNDREVLNNLFDNNASTKYLTAVNQPEVIAKIKDNRSVVIKSYSIASANDQEGRDPKNWVLQGRNNDNEGWTDIDRKENQEFNERLQTRYFNIGGNNASYSQYRLQITANRDNDRLTQFADLNFATEETAQTDNAVGMRTLLTNGPSNVWNQKKFTGWTGNGSLECKGIHKGHGHAYSYNVIYDGLNVKVNPNTNLSYVICPALANGEKYDYEFTSMHVAVDLKFTDGTYLSDLSALDQNGNIVRAQDQADSRVLLTNQWNHIYSTIGEVANGKTIDKVLIVYDMKSHENDDFANFLTYFDDIEIYDQDTPVYEHLSDYVNILRGSNGTGDFSTGLTAPAVTVPNGFNFWTPSNQERSNTIYHYQETGTFRYIQASHEPSIWVGDRGTWQFMINTSKNSGTNDNYSLSVLKGNYSHENEVAKAHYYKIRFNEDGGDAANSQMEVTPTSHGAVVRFKYDNQAGNRSIIFECNRGGKIESYDGRSFRAYSDHKDNGSKRMYVYGEFSENPTGTKINDTRSIASFDKNEVVMRVATSYISYDQAKKNLELEIGNDSFDTVYGKAQAEWDKQLGIITDVKGASYEQLVTLYSCIYRMYCYPNLMSENTGSASNPVWKYKSPYRDENADPVDGKIYINNGFWDTYRTAWSAYSLFTPTKAGEYLDGLVQHYKDQGWVPRWIAPGGTNSMVGTSSDVIFGDAVVKGIPFDQQDAYRSALRNAASVSNNLTNGGRNQLNVSNFIGYSPGGGENFSWSIEGYINDYGIAQMAKKLADQTNNEVEKNNYLSEYYYYLNRSKNYSLMFSDSGSGLDNKWLRGREGNGNFTTGNWYNDKFDPFWFGADYTETNAFNMSVSVPQDGIGLANLYGGRDMLADKLDTIFTTDGGFRGYNAYDGVGGIHEQKECREIKLGQYGHSNQPSHHIPYMYLYSSRPWETQKYVRDIMDRCYAGATFGQGYIGDEDNGEMSAWYVQSAIGFYPLTMGSGEYAIGSPLFEEVTVNLEGGKKLVIKANNNTKENVYVDSMYVNGEKYDQSFISYDALEKGGTIEFNMSAEPNKKRGSSTEQLVKSTTGDNKPQVYKDLSDQADKGGSQGAENLNDLFDNNSNSNTKIANTTTLQFKFNEAKAVRMITLSSAENGRTPDVAQIYGSNNANDWTLLGEYKDNGTLYFGWERYTRPFAIDAEKVAKYTNYRLVLTGTDAYLAEVELLGYDGEDILKSDLNQALATAEKAEVADQQLKDKLDAAIAYGKQIYNDRASNDDQIKDAYQRLDSVIDLKAGKAKQKDASHIEAEEFDAKSDAIVNDGQNIGGVKENSWVKYDNVVFGANTNQLEIRYAAQQADAGGYAEIYLDDRNSEPAGKVELPATGDGWGDYQTVEGKLDKAVSGMHDLYVVFRNDGSHTYVANTDWFAFSSDGTEPEPVKYTVEYYKQNASLDNYSLEQSEELEGTAGTEAVAEEKKFDGFVLNAEAGTTSGIIAEDGSLVLKLYYDREQYAIRYEGIDGITNANELPNNYWYGISQKLVVPVKDGYAFDGWYTEEEYTNQVDELADDRMGDITLYAKFTNPVALVIESINNIGAVTVDAEDRIAVARQNYDLLTDEQKAQVTNYEKLENAEKELKDQKDRLQEAQEQQNQEAEDAVLAEAVIKAINEIGTVTLERATEIYTAREAYDALTENQKKLVTNYELLQKAEEEYKNIAGNDQAAIKEEADRKAAQVVIDLIDNLGVITKDSGDKLSAAQAAYDALTDDQKKLVSNVQILTDAKQQYENLVKADETGNGDNGQTNPSGENGNSNTNGDQNGNGGSNNQNNQTGNGSTNNQDSQTGNGNANNQDSQTGNGNANNQDSQTGNGSTNNQDSQTGNGSVNNQDSQTGNGSVNNQDSQTGNGSVNNQDSQTGNGSANNQDSQTGNGSANNQGSQTGNGSANNQDSQTGNGSVNNQDSQNGSANNQDSQTGNGSAYNQNGQTGNGSTNNQDSQSGSVNNQDSQNGSANNQDSQTGNGGTINQDNQNGNSGSNNQNSQNGNSGSDNQAGSTQDNRVDNAGVNNQDTSLTDDDTIEVSTTFKYKKLYYRVTKSTANSVQVKVVKPDKKNYKTITIPATVKYKGITCKVTAVGKNAFKGNTKLKSVTIGKNVTTIETNAFYNCKNLNKVTFKKSPLKKVGKGAFLKTSKNLKIKTGAKKTVQKYKKLLNKKVPSGSTITK